MKPKSSTIEVYTPHPFDIIISQRKREDSKKRVQLTSAGYRYEPSSEYKRFVSHKFPVIRKKH